jgi:hypothetical protein
VNKSQQGAVAVAFVAFLLSLRKGPGKLIREPVDPATLKGLFYGNLVSDDFAAELLQVAARLGFDPNDLMTVFRIERGKSSDGKSLGRGVYHKYTDKAGVEHKGNFSYGLFGILPGTAVWLGTTPEAIYNMSDIEQLALVEQYFKKHGWDQQGKHPIATFDDIYSGVWGGQSMIDADLYKVLVDGKKDPDTYEKNKGADFNKDGRITKKDVLTIARQMYRQGKKEARQ